MHKIVLTLLITLMLAGCSNFIAGNIQTANAQSSTATPLSIEDTVLKHFSACDVTAANLKTPVSFADFRVIKVAVHKTSKKFIVEYYLNPEANLDVIRAHILSATGLDIFKMPKPKHGWIYIDMNEENSGPLTCTRHK